MIRIGERDLELAELRAIWSAPVEVTVTPDAMEKVEAAEQTVTDVIASGRTVYGINTGFGLLASTRIKADELAQLQANLVLSHAAGVGEALPSRVVRLLMLLKVASLAQGYSGVRTKTIETLITLINNNATPVIPSQGSVGASGDLAPLAHMSTTLIGAGHLEIDGKRMPAAEGLARLGLEPLDLGPKEGLALLNGTQVSTALALAGLFECEDVLSASLYAGAASVDAAKGSDTPFDNRIHAVRRHPGQINVAATLRAILRGSAVRASHTDCDRVQDPYCLRCMPQVMGAVVDQVHDCAVRLQREANAVTDNPLVFNAEADILSGGNFHAEPVALAADALAIAIAETGNMSERRTAMLIDPHMSGLPAFLVNDGGLNSGFMIAQVTAAALAGENKCLAHPASVDSIPTSANQEDHVSMATHAARRLLDMTRNARHIVAVELLAAVQGIEFHRPQKSSRALEELISEIRSMVPNYGRDRLFAPDLATMEQWLADSPFYQRIGELIPSHA